MIWIAIPLGALFAVALWTLTKSQGPKKSLRRTLPERRKVHLPMIIEANSHQAFSVSTYDISLGGCYICFSDMQNSMNKTALLGRRTGIKIGDGLKIRVHAGRFSSLSLEGRVVRLELDSQGSYPAGFGIQFHNLNRSRVKRLKQIVGGETSLRAA